VQGLVEEDDDEDEVIFGESVLLGRAISTLFPELIFSDVAPVDCDEAPCCPVAKGKR
jgi:hypothetical protein